MELHLHTAMNFGISLLLRRVLFISSLLLIGAAPAFAGDTVSGKGKSDLFVPSKEKALYDARYWAREKAKQKCKKLGGSPSLSASATTYSESACQTHPKNPKLMKCRATAHTLCSGLSTGIEHTLSCPEGRKVSYRRKLLKAWSNQRLLVFESDQFSQTLKLNRDEYDDLVVSEDSKGQKNGSPKDSAIMKKIQETLCAARQKPGVYQKLKKKAQEQLKLMTPEDREKEKEIKRCQKFPDKPQCKELLEPPSNDNSLGRKG